MMNDKVLVAGAGGFIGGHLVKRLLDDGHEVVAVDVKPSPAWYQYHEKAMNITMLDLKKNDQAEFVHKMGINREFMLAADMGGMGYIDSHKVNCMLSVLISANMVRHAANYDLDKYLYSSSACIYPGYMQDEQNVFLSEADAYPADPEPGYGLEKLFSEELTINVGKEFPISTYVPRLHNVYGPYGTYDGGREKAPAAICRKVIKAKLSGDHRISIWGDGQQTRSFMYVDDCIEGFMRLMDSDLHAPVNLGSEQLVTINHLVDAVEAIADIELEREYDLSKPQGVRGRCSDNTFIKSKLGWAPSISLGDGLERTYGWIYDQMVKDYK